MDNASLNLTDDIWTSFEKKNSFDEFQLIYHSILLLYKLELSGIKCKTLNYLKSYLKHRKQFVSFGKNENSIYRRITCGVP